MPPTAGCSGQGRRRPRAVRRPRLAARLCTRRHQLVFRVQDAARAGRARPAHLRFQVSLPSVNSALPPRIFPDPGDVAKVRPGFTEALAAEIDTIVGEDPERAISPSNGTARPRCRTPTARCRAIRPRAPSSAIVEQFRTLSPRMPESGQLGYHFCFGTLGGWPRFAPADLSATVALANAMVEALGPPRRLDPHPGARRRR